MWILGCIGLGLLVFLLQIMATPKPRLPRK